MGIEGLASILLVAVGREVVGGAVSQRVVGCTSAEIV